MVDYVDCVDQLNLISHFGTSQPSAVNTILSQDLKLIYCMVHTNPSYAYKLFKSRTFFIFHQAHGYIILTKLFLAFLVFSTPKIEFLVLGEENYIFFLYERSEVNNGPIQFKSRLLNYNIFLNESPTYFGKGPKYIWHFLKYVGNSFKNIS